MSFPTKYIALSFTLAALILGGCGIHKHQEMFNSEILKYGDLAESIGNNGVSEEAIPLDVEFSAVPLTATGVQREFFDLTVEQAVIEALTNSKVLRNLGGRLVQFPQTVRTIMDPSIIETDPQNGIEGALSAFDAEFASSLFFEKNDRAINSIFDGQGNNFFQQDLGTFQTELTKTGASGTSFTLGQNIVYDLNNSPPETRLLPRAWDTQIQAEIRQPLLQGKGVAFNRVAGPEATPGNVNGVVIARLNTDISQLDFERGIRDLVSNVENAYWDLYYAYRLLKSKIAARDAALDTWKTFKAKDQIVEEDKLFKASEQYWRFQEEVVSAKTGKVIDGTRSNNGSTGGTFQGNIGVQVAERRLRLLMGWDINDNRQIRPAADPAIVEVGFDWQAIVHEAVTNRTEIRRQELFVKRAGLEVAASQNFLLPRVDLVSGYRWRGLGDEVNDSYSNLLSGDFQEWYVGTEAAAPIGFRRAHSAVRNAKLRQSRQQAILNEVRQQVVYDLSNAYANLDRSYELAKINWNRRIEAQRRKDSLKNKLAVGRTGPDDIDAILDAERRAAEADAQFFQSLVSYVVSIKNVHLEKGSLLTYNKVYLAGLAPSSDRSRQVPAASVVTKMPNVPNPVDQAIERSESTGPELSAPIEPTPDARPSDPIKPDPIKPEPIKPELIESEIIESDPVKLGSIKALQPEPASPLQATPVPLEGEQKIRQRVRNNAEESVQQGSGLERPKTESNGGMPSPGLAPIFDSLTKGS